MRWMIILLLGVAFVSTASAQDSRPGRNHFISINPLSNFGMGYLYKREINSGLWWKAGLSHLRTRMELKSRPPAALNRDDVFLLQGAVESSIEWRHQLKGFLTLYQGPGLGMETSYSRSKKLVNGVPRLDARTVYMGASIDWTIGLQVKATDHFATSLQLNPGLTVAQIHATGLDVATQRSRGLSFGSMAGLVRLGMIFIP